MNGTAADSSCFFVRCGCSGGGLGGAPLERGSGLWQRPVAWRSESCAPTSSSIVRIASGVPRDVPSGLPTNGWLLRLVSTGRRLRRFMRRSQLNAFYPRYVPCRRNKTYFDEVRSIGIESNLG